MFLLLSGKSWHLAFNRDSRLEHDGKAARCIMFRRVAVALCVEENRICVRASREIIAILISCLIGSGYEMQDSFAKVGI